MFRVKELLTRKLEGYLPADYLPAFIFVLSASPAVSHLDTMQRFGDFATPLTSIAKAVTERVGVRVCPLALPVFRTLGSWAMLLVVVAATRNN